MLTDEMKQDIQLAYSNFITSKGYRARMNQRIMIAEIAKVVANSPEVEERASGDNAAIAVVEAGTGIGKTIAYMISLLPIAKALEKKIIISTATVALQEQILHKDLPDLREHSGLEFSFALAKGRGRYLCTSKLINVLGAQGQEQTQLFDVDMPTTLDRYGVKRLENFKNAYLEGDWNGDKDSWDGEVYDREWRHVTATHYECGGRRCQFIDSCPFYSARSAMQEADCVIVNHDLVLSDLALGGGVVLPAPSDSIYVFDEGHHLHEKAINHFSQHIRIKNTEQWLHQFLQEIPQCAQQLPWAKHGQSCLDKLVGPVKNFREMLLSSGPVWQQLSADQEHFRFPDGVIPEDIQAVSQGFLSPLRDIVNTLEGLLSTLKDMEEDLKVGSLQAMMEHWQSILGLSLRRFQSSLQLWVSYSYPDKEGCAPRARWLNRLEIQGDADIQLNSSPILGDDVLSDYLWRDCFSAVLTSATLSTAGDFGRLKMQTGLDDDCHYASLESPFDYPNAAVLLVPTQAADPVRETEHLEGIVSYVHERVSLTEGTLVLFNSQRQMEEAFDALSSVYQDITLAQGASSKQSIVRQHKARIDEGEGSIIFGLASFAEGIDLPGEYLTHVIIARIPFAVPSDPASEALYEWLEKSSRNPFFEVSVPDASMKLVQACGRLLRNENDRGTVALLDRRIVSKGYGRKIIESLPPFKVIVEPQK